MYWHKQDKHRLNDPSNTTPRQPGWRWREGRAWVHNRDHDYHHDSGVRVWPIIPQETRVEWYLLRKKSGSWAVGYGRDDEDHSLHVRLPLLVDVYLSWHNKRFQPKGWEDSHTEYAIRHHDGHLWWRFGGNPMGGGKELPWWRDGNIDWARLTLGKSTFTRELIETRTMPLPLPEGTVAAEVTQTRFTWKRKRSPFARHAMNYNIKPLYPAAVPGKGENAWDCGDDAIFELSCSAESFEAAIGRFVESVLTSRRRHGGTYEWQPQPERLRDAA